MKSTSPIKFNYPNLGTLYVNLTPEQKGKIQNLEGKTPSIWDVGFVHPNQISSYFCARCNLTCLHSPNTKGFIELDIPNNPVGSISYYCDKGHLIHYSFLPTPEEIPVEFIEFDETGDYKIPTIDSVDSLLIKIEEQARKGRGNKIDNPSHKNRLEVANRLAGKIDYDVSKRVKEINEIFRGAYVRNLESQLPRLVEEIIENSYEFSLDEMDGFTHYEVSLAEKVNELFETVKLITPTEPELNQKIVRILDAYWMMHDTKRKRLVEEKKQLEDRVDSFEENLIEIRRNQSKFIRRVKLTNEQVQKARDNPLESYLL
ncbi:MAG: hypothetical protein U9Q06_03760 [Nanoarchaeota archaeon]|nr:hypothetical protein [Nanoarchaeota archaeon]